MEINYKVDAKGLACPMPIVKTRKAVQEMDAGHVIEIEATDKGSTADLEAWAKSVGHEYIGTTEEEGVLKHYLRKADGAEKEEEKHPHVVSNEQLASLLGERDVVILDVREAVEYAFGHIPTAKSMPMGTVQKQLENLDKAQTFYIVCRTGNRSDVVAKQLAAAGFEKVYNVVPGMSGWNGTTTKGEV